MKYLTAKQVEALSPVKREVYHKRLMRDIEKRQEEIIRDWLQVPKSVSMDAIIASCAMMIDYPHIKTLAAALAIKQQHTEKLKNEITSLYEES